jgi:hypothetical protein
MREELSGECKLPANIPVCPPLPILSVSRYTRAAWAIPGQTRPKTVDVRGEGERAGLEPLDVEVRVKSTHERKKTG